MNKEQIERTAHAARERIVEHHTSVQPFPIRNLIDLVDPRWACHLEGIRVRFEADLGRFGQGNDRFEVAGVINRPEKQILISQRFSAAVQKFTLAHELGHWYLHPENAVQHRDRPIVDADHTSQGRPPMEREADFFASCFLLPREAITLVFKHRFGIRLPFRFDETSAFWLRRDDPDSLIFSDKYSLERELALATCTHYNCQSFQSLASVFGVSPKVMAIRLRELELVRWP